MDCRPKIDVGTEQIHTTLFFNHIPIQIYQLAFLTPGMCPAKAFMRKLNYISRLVSICPLIPACPHPGKISTPLRSKLTYPRHPEIPQYPSALSSFDASISDLCRSCVAVHLGQLELCLCSRSRGEGHIADDVSKSLPIDRNVVSRAPRYSVVSGSSVVSFSQIQGVVPFGFMLSKDLPLCVISNNLDVDKAPQVELL